MSLESLLFFFLTATTTGIAYYTVRQYLKVVAYEQQVDRGWNDLVTRADKMLSELNEIKSQIKSKKVGKPKTK